MPKLLARKPLNLLIEETREAGEHSLRRTLGVVQLTAQGITPKTNFGPRIGLAYQVTPKLVVRAEYRIVYGGIFNVGGGANLGNNYPFAFGLNFVPPTAVPPVTPDLSIGTLAKGLLTFRLRPDLVNAAGLNLRGAPYDYQRLCCENRFRSIF